MLLPMVGEAYTTLAPGFSAQTCINWYPAVNQQEHQGKYSSLLYPTPGVTLFSSISGGPVRGLYTTPTILYAVVGSILYSVDITGTATSIGTLLTNSGRVSMISNLTQLMLVDGSYGYVYTPSTNTFTQITDIDFPVCSRLSYQDGYALTVDNNNQFWISDLNNFLSWTATSVATPESCNLQNKLVACESSHLECWLFGTSKTEIWLDTGAIPFPFSRLGTTYLETGCAAQFSIVNVDNTLIWLSRTEYGQLMVVRAEGYNPRVISTEALHKEFNSYSIVSDAFAYSYQDNGHLFYIVTFPSAGKTWAYDCSTNLWHQRSSGIDSNNTQGRHLSNCYAFFNGQHIVGSYKNGNLYKLSSNAYDDIDTPIIRERTFATFTQETNRYTVHEFQIDLEPGQGSITGQGVTPRMMLSFSDDGAKTFGNELLGNPGGQGQYTTLMRWERLGQYRNCTPKITTSDPIFWAPFAARALVTMDSF